MFGLAGIFLSGAIINFDIATEQALDTGFYIIHSRVYSDHLHHAVLGLITVNFQARYFGLCSVMYVYACCDTCQLIPDRFARMNALCVFKPWNSQLLS